MIILARSPAAHLTAFVVDDGVEEGEDCYLQVRRVLRLVQAPRQIHNQRLQKKYAAAANAHARKRRTC